MEGGPEHGLPRLVRAARGTRPVEGRLTGGFAHAPLARGSRPPTALLSAAVDLRRDGGESPHVRGATELLVGKVDSAVAALTKALEASRTPAVLNDLAVAHLERSARQHTARDLVDAYELADEARRSDPSLREPAFNRALAIERLGLRAEAIEAWREVAARDTDPAWKGEAAERAQKLAVANEDELRARFAAGLAVARDAASMRALVDQYPQMARTHFEEELLGQWAYARDREPLLATMRLLAAALHEITGNPLPRRAVAAIDEVANRELLVRGHAAFHEGMRRYRRLEVRRAEEDLATAEDLLRRAGSPFAAVALFYRGVARSFDNDLAGTLRLLDETQEEVDRLALRGTPLHGHVQWMRGKTLLNQGLPHASLSALQEALAVFEPTRENESIAAIHDLLAWNYDFLGDEERAWSHYATALRRVAGGQSRRRERIVLHDLTYHATYHKRHRVALLYASSLVRLCRAAGDPSDVARSLIDRSRALHAVGERDAAWADFREASLLETRVADPGVRADLQADLAVAEAHLAADESPLQRMAVLDRAIAIVRAVQKHTLLPRLVIDRAEAAVAAQQPRDAERSLGEAIEVIERQRWSVTDPDLQIGYAEEWYRAFDAMIDLLVRAGRTDEALSFAERSRARVLARSAGDRRAPERLDNVRRRMPDGVAAIVYASLETSTVAWVVRNDGVTCVRLDVDAKTLRPLIDAGTGSLAALHDALLRPLAAELRPAERLVFVPDKTLHRVPFGALYDAAVRRWLVEERAVGVVPTLGLFVAALERDRVLAAERNAGMLLVADPAFARERFPDLPRLTGAAAEARVMAARYRDAEILSGEAGTRARFLAAAARAPVVQVSAHALLNERHPSRSALLLAAEGNDPGILYAFEIDREKFPVTRLMILAACSTASGKQTLYEGPLGLARSFVAAGVPTVVAPLWDVEDDASRELILAFHERLRAGDDAPDALRAAQLRMIRHANPSFRRPAAWGGFQVMGGFFDN